MKHLRPRAPSIESKIVLSTFPPGSGPNTTVETTKEKRQDKRDIGWVVVGVLSQDYFDIVRYYCGIESQDSTGFEFDLLN